ncbi:MAG: cupin domain-containing protein [Synechococcus sp. SB0666_bin_14]|nr:cupin domain-containing protein [Synechococcus sp. SB0666_bin_14]MYA91528.1 cupin domain-containing protein [Synechococcus sp. SB0663_bin_10]MYG46235.1 cupin domain-containing protein [Synechococcus sp. SB0675_bin_6]MYJ59958.1 cupin domain-containing protein [Synechococcus sp. SB0672_bin_6]MYK92073.1 cupin domain-containing protein [Synechococcus sp. SB0669_bin_8]
MTRMIAAEDVPPRIKQSNYPQPFLSLMAGREKKALGDVFGLKNFGVNLTRIAPGGMSALMHSHSRQDELVYVLEGSPTLVTPSGDAQLGPGMCAGFPAGGEAHHIVNHTSTDVLILEIGDRSDGDEARYPQDDLHAVMGAGGQESFTHQDGTP